MMISLKILVGGYFRPVLLFVGGILWVFCPSLAEPNESVFLRHQELGESSGVAVSRDGQWLFTHNDSGDRPRVFVFDQQGVPRSELVLRSAKAKDWEDICSFSLDGQDYLAVGDVGDNLQRRKSVTIYVFKQPTGEQLDTNSIFMPIECELTVTFDVGPINCEALAYDPQRQSFVLASKEPLRSRLFEVKWTELRGSQECVARYRQTLYVPLVTGADISRDGTRLVMCSYAAGTMLFRDDENEAELWRLPANGGVFSLPVRRQGEAICFAEAGSRLLLTSEFAPSPLFNIATPKFDAGKPE